MLTHIVQDELALPVDARECHTVTQITGKSHRHNSRCVHRNSESELCVVTQQLSVLTHFVQDELAQPVDSPVRHTVTQISCKSHRHSSRCEHRNSESELCVVTQQLSVLTHIVQDELALPVDAHE